MQLERLKERFLELLKIGAHFGHTIGKITWEEQACMPSGAVSTNAPAKAFLEEQLHRVWSGDELRDVIEELQRSSELSPVMCNLVSWAEFAAYRARALPVDHVGQWSLATSRAQEIWLQARKDSNFAMFQPELAKVIALARERADFFGYAEDGERYDGLLGGFEPGMTTKELRRILLPLRSPLSDLAKRLANHPNPPRNDFLNGDFHPDRQLEFSTGVIRAMGFDVTRGSITVVKGHPMTITCGPDDVRFTTRVHRDNFRSAFFAAVHEAGHGMYDQGRDPVLNWISMETISMAIHESQSRLWENIIARGFPFWRHFFPTARIMFAPAFDHVSDLEMWLAVNRVSPSCIRIEADEVTYNLHILLRFELELALLSGDLLPQDLPGVWNEKMQEYLGIVPPNDAQGCLQDVHWSLGYIGYFPTYSLGNLLSAQLWAKMEKDLPDVRDSIVLGYFQAPLGWLRQLVHPWGQVMTLNHLANMVTGQPLSADNWLKYIEDKFYRVYNR